MAHKKSERIKIADEAIEAKKNGIDYTVIAERYGVGYHTMLNWVKLRKNGTLQGDIPKDALSTVFDEFKQLGALEAETIHMMVFTGNIKDKNFLIINVEKPDITDPDEYDQELRNRIMSGLKYGFAAAGFKLMEDA